MKQHDVKISRMTLIDMEQTYVNIANRVFDTDTAMGK